jgi:hypothetical protein
VAVAVGEGDQDLEGVAMKGKKVFGRRSVLDTAGHAVHYIPDSAIAQTGRVGTGGGSLLPSVKHDQSRDPG